MGWFQVERATNVGASIMAVWLQRESRRSKWTRRAVLFLAFLLAAIVIVYDSFRGGIRAFVSCSVCSVVGLLLGRPLARWWLAKPTLRRAVLCCVYTLLILFACATWVFVVQNVLWR
jgi:hypothetical protein